MTGTMKAGETANADRFMPEDHITQVSIVSAGKLVISGIKAKIPSGKEIAAE